MKSSAMVVAPLILSSSPAQAFSVQSGSAPSVSSSALSIQATPTARLPSTFSTMKRPGVSGITALSMRQKVNENRVEKDKGSTNEIKPRAPNVHAPFSLSPRDVWVRQAIKNVLYAQVGLARSLGTAMGKQDPYTDFQVDDIPPSMFVNHRIRPEKLEDFKTALNLPENIDFMPIACTEGSTPEYQITLNAYHVSGITNGLRAEWSTYIDRGDGRPSFLVIDAQTDNFSMDPVDIITKPSEFTYIDEDSGMKLNIAPGNDRFYTFEYSGDREGNELVLPNRTWIAANDYIFWGNGVCDRAFYDGAVMDSPLVMLKPEECKIVYNMPFKDFTESEASEVFLLSSPARFVISPMYNLNEKHEVDEGKLFKF